MQSPWYRSLSVNFFNFHFALFYLIQTGSSVRVSTGRVVCMRIFHTCHISNCDGLNPFRTKWSHTYVCTIYYTYVLCAWPGSNPTLHLNHRIHICAKLSALQKSVITNIFIMNNYNSHWCNALWQNYLNFHWIYSYH